MITIRPAEVTRLSKEKYLELSQRPSGRSGYVFKGRDHDYSFFGELRAKEIIHLLNKERGCCSRMFWKMKVLDIGTGAGAFLHSMPYGVKGYGITATQMRKAPPDDTYRICNAEELDEQFPSNHFDLIVSRLAFRHFVDPHMGLKQAYRSLKSGGYLVIDHFALNGIDTEYWIQEMKRRGYEMAAVPAFDYYGRRNSLECLVIKKTQNSLDSPLLYDQIANGRCIYRMEGVPSPEQYDESLHSYLNTMRKAHAYRLDLLESDQFALSPDRVKILEEEDKQSEGYIESFQRQLEAWNLPVH